MRFLVTGCTSYIAKYAINKLIEQGHNVVGISRSRPDIKDDLFKWIRHDLSKASCNVEGKVDVVVHMAAQSLLNRSAEEYTEANILVTYHTREIAIKLKPKVVIFTSSIKIYGEIKDSIVTEKMDIINPDLYGITKYLGEKILEEAVPTVSLRMPGVIATESHGWIDKMYRKLKADEPIELFNSPYNHVVHAYDIFGIINTISNENNINTERYNICADDVSTSLNVVNQMAEFIGSGSTINDIPSDSKINHIISNKKLLNLYHPLNVSDTINLYLKEMGEVEGI